MASKAGKLAVSIGVTSLLAGGVFSLSGLLSAVSGSETTQLAAANTSAAIAAEAIAQARENPVLEIVWKSNGSTRTLASWSQDVLKKHAKRVDRRELDPITGEVARWSGVPFKDLLEEALAPLSVDDRAVVDLVEIQGPIGIEAYVPRAFIQKYNYLLSFDRDGGGLGPRGPFYAVVPWTSQSGVKSEWIPIRKFFVPGIHRIVLTNLKDRYGFAYLQARKDPLALRGEKIFVRNCLGCHSTAKWPKNSVISSEVVVLGIIGAHRTLIQGTPPFSELDRKALNTYINAADINHPTLVKGSEVQN